MPIKKNNKRSSRKIYRSRISKTEQNPALINFPTHQKFIKRSKIYFIHLTKTILPYSSTNQFNLAEAQLFFFIVIHNPSYPPPSFHVRFVQIPWSDKCQQASNVLPIYLPSSFTSIVIVEHRAYTLATIRFIHFTSLPAFID